MIITKTKKPKYELSPSENEDFWQFVSRIIDTKLQLADELKDENLQNRKEKEDQLKQLITQYEKIEAEYSKNKKAREQTAKLNAQKPQALSVAEKTDDIGVNTRQFQPRRFKRLNSTIPPDDVRKINFWNKVFGEAEEIKESKLSKILIEKFKFDNMKSLNVILKADYEGYIEPTNTPNYVSNHIYRKSKNETIV